MHYKMKGKKTRQSNKQNKNKQKSITKKYIVELKQKQNK